MKDLITIVTNEIAEELQLQKIGGTYELDATTAGSACVALAKTLSYPMITSSKTRNLINESLRNDLDRKSLYHIIFNIRTTMEKKEIGSFNASIGIIKDAYVSLRTSNILLATELELINNELSDLDAYFILMSYANIRLINHSSSMKS